MQNTLLAAILTQHMVIPNNTFKIALKFSRLFGHGLKVGYLLADVVTKPTAVIFNASSSSCQQFVFQMSGGGCSYTFISDQPSYMIG